MKIVSAPSIPILTSTQIGALPTGTGRFPQGTMVYNSTTSKLQVNNGSDAAQTWADIAPAAVASINTQTANYVLALSDAQNIVEMNLAGANTLTVPPNSTVAFPTGTSLTVVQYGAGQTTLTPGAGVTIRSPGPALKIAAQYGAATLYKRATDEWVAMGNLTP